jgi:single-stranded DNA-binding protein
MQTLFLTGNLAADCEIVKGKDDAEFIRFTVASNEPGASKEDKPTYYSCRMKKTGVAELLKKGRYVALVGNLHIWENIKAEELAGFLLTHDGNKVRKGKVTLP